MYRLPKKQLSLLDDFYRPFSGNLCADNRWVQLAGIIPWDAVYGIIEIHRERG